jgi:hypothetical protein
VSFRILLSAIAASLVSCSIPYELGDAGGTTPRPVSLLRLISNPAAYDGQIVWVAGVIAAEYEASALYTTREHYRSRITEYSVSVSFSPSLLEKGGQQLEKLSGRYVLVQGVYRTAGEYSTQLNGRIEEIVQIRTVD